MVSHEAQRDKEKEGIKERPKEVPLERFLVGRLAFSFDKSDESRCITGVIAYMIIGSILLRKEGCSLSWRHGGFKKYAEK